MRLLLSLLILSTELLALPLKIIPKEGTTLPTQMTPGYNVTAYYTVINKTATTLKNLYVKYLPPNVSQVTTNGDYPDTCGATFSLAPNESCTLQLLISGPVTASGGSNNQLFICLPGGTACTGTSYPLEVEIAPWLPLESSYEIAYTANVLDHPKDFVPAYKEGGTNPISGSAWETYTPPTGYSKNTTRYLQFNESISLGGPGDPTGTETYITTSDGYTWGIISNTISAMWPFDASQYAFPSNLGPFYAGNLTVTPPPGVIKFTANYKAQLMKYYAKVNGEPILRYFLTDAWGNQYIMQASDYSTPDEVTASFQAAILPAGWTKEMKYLDEDFILSPSRGPANTFAYNLIRDNQNNTYDQITWSPSGILLASKIQESGMPIWGGLETNVIKISNSFDNLLVGGGGVTAFIFPSTLTGGVNTIIDFNPYLGDTLDFDGQTYTAIVSTYGTKIYLSGGAQVLLEGVFLFMDSWVVN